MKKSRIGGGRLAAALVLTLLTTGCVESAGREGIAVAQVSSCMKCHNGSNQVDYAGPGIENPHPFPGAANIGCVVCHGGNGDGEDKDTSHVPPPPEIGDRDFQDNNNQAYFNRLTLVGIDKVDDYTVNGVTYTGIDYLQFVNPGDLRVVTQGRSCGICHAPHAETVSKSVLATETGVFSGAMYAIGADNRLGNTDYENTAADLGWRAVQDAGFNPAEDGSVQQLLEFPVYSVKDANGAMDIDGNPIYDAAELDDDVDPLTGKVITGSPLANLMHEQIAFTCGDCHLGSAGANNRYGDFRSSGCTSCHMPYSLDGRSRSLDPNVPKDEPADPDQIDDPERAHVRAHRIASVSKTLPTGEQIQGIDDYACAGCHQGSNRTVMQYWGIRLDQNEDLHNDVQYPQMPFVFEDTRGDPRLFDPDVRNRTFNGRRGQQYIKFEDYDNDQRDDTPADVHYEAGMGCIDCHGSYDVHGGNVASGGKISSRMEHGVAIQCEDCHGSSDGYAGTTVGRAYDGQQRTIAVDSKGNPLPHVVLEGDGHFYLYSRLDGRRHFVVQTHDVVVNNQKDNPLTGETIYSEKASYAMGRDDGNPLTGIGPNQAAPTGFKHGDNMDCASCHASWTNTCMGCHLEGEYDRNNNFSNITGDEIVFEERNADFVYQSPLFFQLGVNSRNKITQVSSNTKMFFKWRDRRGEFSKVFAFSDRNNNGNDPTKAGALGHNAIMAHSIRGKVDDQNEGPRYCASCHLTRTGLDDNRALYDTFRAALRNDAFDQLDFDELRAHFGRNTGNRLNSPLFVHAVAGLGSGLFLFDENGCAVNPLDNDDNRKGCDPVSPADRLQTVIDNGGSILDLVKFNLDRIVDLDTVNNTAEPRGSSNHALMQPGPVPNLRDGAPNPNMAGPLGARLLRRLTDPDAADVIVLEYWYDADGNPQGVLPPALQPPPQAAPQKKK